MNQLVYNDLLKENTTLYLSSIKKAKKTKPEIDFKQYRKNSLYYLVKLNLEKQKKNLESIEYSIFSFIEKNLDDILIGSVLKLEDLKERFEELILTHLSYKKIIANFYGLQIPLKDIKISPYELKINFFDDEGLSEPKIKTLRDILQIDLFKYNSLNKEDRKLIITSVKNKLCPYCSRNYINLIDGVTHNMGINLDHYYGKSNYPLFAISFFNLIPSCQPCNSAFKGRIDFDSSFIHPVKDNIDSGKFTLKLTKVEGQYSVLYFLNQSNFEVDYAPNYSKKYKELDYYKFKKSVDFFQLKKIYNAHKDVVQRTLLDYYVYQEGGVLKSIQKTFPKLNLKHKALGISTSKKDWSELPFGKLRYDILTTLIDKKVNELTDYNDVF